MVSFTNGTTHRYGAMVVTYNPKLLTLFKRGAYFKVDTLYYSTPEFALIDNWLVTEKIDGTSVILSLSKTGGGYYGRTPKSQFNVNQTKFMESETDRLLGKVWPILSTYGLDSIDVYAELVGPDVQGNPYALDEHRLYVFDMRAGGYWLNTGSVYPNCDVLDVRRPSVLDNMTTDEVIFLVRGGFQSTINPGVLSEGVVARTDPLLYNNRGDRVMFKLKHKDF